MPILSFHTLVQLSLAGIFAESGENPSACSLGGESND